MRTRISLIVSLGTLLAVAPAWAQDEDEVIYEDEERTEVEGERDVTRAREGDKVKLQRPPGSGQAVAPGEVHTVVKGDTLWDLSQSYLGSPWYWPKVWSYNPEIANPHWIYPGNRVRFFPTGEEVPSQVVIGEGPAVVDDDPPTPDEDEVGTVKATGRIGYRPPATAQMALQGFVTQRELEEAGTIAGSFAETQMLSYPDTVYIRFKQKGTAQVGGRYVVFKTVGKVKHPDSGDNIGFLTHFLGMVEVVSIDREFVTALIVGTWDEIHRGDLIGPVNEDLVTRVASRPNEREVEGTLVETMIPYQTIAGEHQVVVVDRGSSHGVQPGNTFQVVRQQDLPPAMDPHKSQDKKWPVEVVGACITLDVKDKASTCLMIRSIREMMKGDKMVMRVSQQTTAAR